LEKSIYPDPGIASGRFSGKGKKGSLSCEERVGVR